MLTVHAGKGYTIIITELTAEGNWEGIIKNNRAIKECRITSIRF